GAGPRVHTFAPRARPLGAVELAGPVAGDELTGTAYVEVGGGSGRGGAGRDRVGTAAADVQTGGTKIESLYRAGGVGVDRARERHGRGAREARPATTRRAGSRRVLEREARRCAGGAGRARRRAARRRGRRRAGRRRGRRRAACRRGRRRAGRRRGRRLAACRRGRRLAACRRGRRVAARRRGRRLAARRRGRRLAARRRGGGLGGGGRGLGGGGRGRRRGGRCHAVAGAVTHAVAAGGEVEAVLAGPRVAAVVGAGVAVVAVGRHPRRLARVVHARLDAGGAEVLGAVAVGSAGARDRGVD